MEVLPDCERQSRSKSLVRAEINASAASVVVLVSNPAPRASTRSSVSKIIWSGSCKEAISDLDMRSRAMLGMTESLPFRGSCEAFGVWFCLRVDA